MSVMGIGLVRAFFFKVLAFALVATIGCKPSGSTLLQSDEAIDGQGGDDVGLEQMLLDPRADELLNYDIDEEIAELAAAMPSLAEQRQANFYPTAYLGEGGREYLMRYQQELNDNAEFRELHSALLEYGQAGLQLSYAEQAAAENAKSITTNLPFGKGSEYWLKESQKAYAEFVKLRDQYSQQGLDDVVVIGFSRFSDDMQQNISGGTGFEAAVAAARAVNTQWNDGLVSEGAGPFEYIIGAGILTSASRSLGRAAVKASALKASATFARNFVTRSIPGAIRSVANGSRVLISKLLRGCVGLGLATNGVCQNAVKLVGQSGIRHGWIKRSLFRELKGIAGPRNFEAFKAALKKGVVAPTGNSGIKHIKGPLFELKINGSAMRILGLRNKDGVVVFTRFVREGLHKSNAEELVEAMLKQAG